jgi:hypothetical protein
MPRAFPYRFEPQASGGVLAQFVDAPEAHTFGASEAEAGGDDALDCLIAALRGQPWKERGRASSPEPI